MNLANYVSNSGSAINAIIPIKNKTVLWPVIVRSRRIQVWICASKGLRCKPDYRI